MKKGLLKTLAAVVTASGIALAASSPAAAADGEELRTKINELQEKQESTQADSEETKKEIEALKEEIQNISDEIRNLDKKITETNDKITKKEEEINQTEQRITELENRIDKLQKRIEERDKLLKERVNAMYKNGGSVDYLEVLMGAKSFGDFLDRVSALNKIASQDKDILQEHINDQNELEDAKKEVEKQRTSLEDSLAELEDLKAEQKKRRDEKSSILGDLENQEHSLQETLISLEDEESLLQKQEEAAKQELENHKERQEAARQQSGGGGAQALGEAPSDSGGTLMRPATGTYTSEFGQRWGRMHNGIDIGGGGRPNVPIVAAAGGTVVKAGYMNGYGNTVMISHQLNGEQITTLYAHMSSLNVSSGQSVSRGENIGMMGNTGASQGKHLHFEVHEGPWNGAKSNAVNPRNYLP
ncbi:murein hydrolase activator EnvC family protein [Salibacterium halotolerans]|uniref:N-terminal domain of peptidoglycan hydrolase CwlO-containing protein n=1 Tax=Salibacterium halotolerans TaxID=1884432 RepID=A0A1I5VSJ3_9BACI|nr:peptidoglycan DD-metalloendopeptidase family protein [Salibacterium halotolerans]SFQ10564.1 N-terminal domain of peptidoglycan hydrolase CwlO-containing protein [Salibacterium halotolerans]